MDKYQFIDRVKEIFNITIPLSVYQELDLTNLYEVVIKTGIESIQDNNLAVDMAKERIAAAVMCLEDATKQLGGK